MRGEVAWWLSESEQLAPLVHDVPRVQGREARRRLLLLVVVKRPAWHCHWHWQLQRAPTSNYRGGVVCLCFGHHHHGGRRRRRRVDVQEVVVGACSGLHAGDVLHHDAEVGGVGADVRGGGAPGRPGPALLLLPRAPAGRRQLLLVLLLVLVVLAAPGRRRRRVGDQHGVAAGGGDVRRVVVVGRGRRGEGG